MGAGSEGYGQRHRIPDLHLKSLLSSGLVGASFLLPA